MGIDTEKGIDIEKGINIEKGIDIEKGTDIKNGDTQEKKLRDTHMLHPRATTTCYSYVLLLHAAATTLRLMTAKHLEG